MRESRKEPEIIVVPHDILHYLPFHALLSPEGKYLIEDHVISYLSSSSIMRFTRGKRKKATDNILAFGNPELDNPVYNLRYAEREAKEIGRIFPGTDVFIRNDATESRAKGLSGSYDVLHFASHAVFNEKHPEDACLMLAMDQWDDGQFSVDEIFSLNLRSSLVVPRMRLLLLCVGKVRERALREVLDDYLDRLRRYLPTEMIEAGDAQTALARLPERSLLCVLDGGGEEWSSPDLSRFIEGEKATSHPAHRRGPRLRGPSKRLDQSN